MVESRLDLGQTAHRPGQFHFCLVQRCLGCPDLMGQALQLGAPTEGAGRSRCTGKQNRAVGPAKNAPAPGEYLRAGEQGPHPRSGMPFGHQAPSEGIVPFAAGRA